MSRRYKYNKRSGALQEAMVPQQTHSPASTSTISQNTDEFDDDGVKGMLTNQMVTRQLVERQRRPSGAVSDSALDPNQNRGRAGMFFYTVEDGQRVLSVDQQGRMAVIEGPQRVWRLGRSFRQMAHYVAHPGEFLIVRYRDGRQEHLAGPAHCWLDPRTHLSVEKEEAVQIAAEEAVVVYSEAEADPDVSRRIVHGPATFVPAPGEWLHTFSWHGSSGGQKVPNGLVFQKLWLLPDQMYHDVDEVRTADDAVITVRLMIFFRLVDIGQMLSTTHDPIGDFVNAATSDVVEFVRRLSFDAFKQQTDQLNHLDTYRQLTRRAEQCGYRIDNVVYRGYGAPRALQQMHEKATESRTRLQLEKATEQQAQELEDLKQERALARAAREREQATADFEHRSAIERRRLEEDLRAQAARSEATRQQSLLDAEAARQQATADDARQQAHLSQLKALDVDLTALLTADRPDRVIELRGAEAGHLHLRDD